jgi:hypothetical protein
MGKAIYSWSYVAGMDDAEKVSRPHKDHAAKETTMKRTLRHTIASIVVSTALASSLPPTVYAGEFSSVIWLTDRERVELLLTEHGVQAAEARARAAALTDEEATRLAAEIDALPAGGDAVDNMFNYVVGVFVLIVAVVGLIGFLIKKAGETSRSSGSPAIDVIPSAGDPAPSHVPYQAI